MKRRRLGEGTSDPFLMSLLAAPWYVARMEWKSFAYHVLYLETVLEQDV
jgi:hypothetical protein